MTSPISRGGNHHYRQPSLTDNAIKWLNEKRAAVKDVFNSPGVLIPIDLMKITSYIVSLSHDIFKKLHGVKPTGALLEAKKVAIIPLVAIPITLFAFMESMIDFGKSAKNGDNEALAHAALLATAAFGDVVEIPAKIGGVVEIFQPVAQIDIWGPSLYAVSAILSVAGLIYAALSHEKTRGFAAELKEKSQNAILKEIETNDRYASLRKKLNHLGPNVNKKLNKEFFKALKAVAKAHNKNELMATFANFSHEIRYLTYRDWQLLEEVGDIAYINCLKEMDKKDNSILSRNFQVDRDKILSAIENIKNSNDPKAKSNAVHLLKSRVSYKFLSDKLSITSNTVGIVASVMFVVLGFVAAASPIAPLAYALLIGLTIYGIGKMITDIYKKYVFEEALDQDFLTPRISQPISTVQAVPIQQSWW